MWKACTFVVLLCAIAVLTQAHAHKIERDHHQPHLAHTQLAAVADSSDHDLKDVYGPQTHRHYKRHANVEDMPVHAPKVHKNDKKHKKKHHVKTNEHHELPQDHAKHHGTTKRHAKNAQEHHHHQQKAKSHNKPQHKQSIKTPKHHQDKRQGKHRDNKRSQHYNH